MTGVLGSEEKSSKLPRLLKIRNPWGNTFEWRVSLEPAKRMANQKCFQGRWSDDDIRANSSLSWEEQGQLVTGVGEWWMSYEDWASCFTHLTICHPEPEPEERQAWVEWKETSFEVLFNELQNWQDLNISFLREAGTRRVEVLVLTRVVLPASLTTHSSASASPSLAPTRFTTLPLLS